MDTNTEDEPILGGSDENGYSWVNVVSSGFSLSQDELKKSKPSQLFAKAQPVNLIVIYTIIIVVTLICIIMIWSISGGDHHIWGVVCAIFVVTVTGGFLWRYRAASRQVSYLSGLVKDTSRDVTQKAVDLKKMADEETGIISKVFTADVAKLKDSPVKSIYNLSQPFQLHVAMIIVIILIAIILIVVASIESDTVRRHSLNTPITIALITCIGLFGLGLLANWALGGGGYKLIDDVALSMNQEANATAITMVRPASSTIAAAANAAA